MRAYLYYLAVLLLACQGCILWHTRMQYFDFPYRSSDVIGLETARGYVFEVTNALGHAPDDIIIYQEFNYPLGSDRWTFYGRRKTPSGRPPRYYPFQAEVLFGERIEVHFNYGH